MTMTSALASAYSSPGSVGQCPSRVEGDSAICPFCATCDLAEEQAEGCFASEKQCQRPMLTLSLYGCSEEVLAEVSPEMKPDFCPYP